MLLVAALACTPVLRSQDAPDPDGAPQSVVAGLYALTVSDATPLAITLPRYVWLTIGHSPRHDAAGDVQPALVGGRRELRHSWTLDDGRLRLSWGGHTSSISIELDPSGDDCWRGLAGSNIDAGPIVPNGWPARLDLLEPGPLDTARLDALNAGELEALLPAPGAVGGHIVRRSNGEPLGGAWQTLAVSLLDAAGQELTRTEARDGRFMMFRLDLHAAPRTVRVHWTCASLLPAYAYLAEPLHAETTVDLSPIPPWPEPLRIELDTGWMARVRVIDAAGVAVPADVSMDGRSITRPDAPTVHELWDVPWSESLVHLTVRTDDGRAREVDVTAPTDGSAAHTVRVVVGD